MRMTFHVAVLSLSISATSPAADLQDHTAVSRYAGSVLTRRDNDGFAAYRLVTGVDQKGKTDEEALKTLSVEGGVTRLAYENPPGRSAGEIFANYRQALEKAGFVVLFACQESECGPTFATSRWNRVTGMRRATVPLQWWRRSQKTTR